MDKNPDKKEVTAAEWNSPYEVLWLTTLLELIDEWMQEWIGG